MLQGFGTALLVCVLAGAAHAAGQPDRPWPPDPSRYDKPGTEILMAARSATGSLPAATTVVPASRAPWNATASSVRSTSCRF